jgi:hypothetical protein
MQRYDSIHHTENDMLRPALSAAAIALLLGCSTTKTSSDQLARVAKDWSLSIRASQVIPVYPLTEDLQPGDVFLVQTPSEDEVKVYAEKGFLPLENLLTRLPLQGYTTFYSEWPGVTDKTLPPRGWQFPQSDPNTSNFALAPLAAFPTYGFSVSRSAGLNLAIPVQSVPIGLNLLDSASANGTISMRDAYTYGLPAQTLFNALEKWARSNRSYLKQFVPEVMKGKEGSAKRYFYLRVVNRVYLVKTVDVSLFDNRASGGTGSAGVPQPVQLLNIANATDAAKRFVEVNQILSGESAAHPAGTAGGADAGAAAGAEAAAGAAAAAPAAGGTVKVTMATSRSISLQETFPRPLVIGYLAFDFPILDDGSLGAPVATLAQLENRPQITGKPIAYTGCDANCEKLRSWLGKPGNPAKLQTWLETNGGVAIADLLTGDHGELRSRAVAEFIGPAQ